MNRSLFIGCFALSLCGLASCTDDKYDLDDVDTTAAIKLDNLVVPVRLSSITLDDVLDIDKDDPDNPVKLVTSNGVSFYAIEESGEFEADEVFLDEIEAYDFATIPTLPLGNISSSIHDATVGFSYLITNVDSSIVSLYRMGLNENKPMKIELSLSGSQGNLENVVLLIPDSFTAYYNGEEVFGGEVNLGNISVGETSEPIYVYAMDFGTGLSPEDGNLDLRGEIIIKSATVNSASSDLTAQFSMSPFTANSVSGSINYLVEEPDIQPISLDNLPDFLKNGESNLIIENPQLFLDFSNPLDVPFHTFLNITPYGNGGNAVNTELEPFVNSIVLAGSIQDIYEGFYNASVLQQVPDLRYILSGNGLPEMIEFNLSDPYLRGDVLNLQLGVNMQLAGRYSFFAPLSFGEGSRIIYTQTETEFFGDDVKDVEVSHLQLSAYPITNLPFDVTLTVYPLDKEGKHILSNGQPVMASGTVAAFADGSRILDLNFNTYFTGLDGVEFTVMVDNMSGVALEPSQFIQLNNIRAKLSGKYITDF